jgi:ribosomal protein S18 acetylase RimI-like enzyme
MPEVRAVGPDDWAAWRALRLIALEESPEAFSSRLADWQGEGDREERWRERLASVPFNVMSFDGDRVMAMASGVPDGDSVELISMYVRPDARGTGVAGAVVEEVARWAAERGAAAVILAVRESNGRARAFYRRLGFAEAGSVSTDPGEPPEVLMRRDAGKMIT